MNKIFHFIVYILIFRIHFLRLWKCLVLTKTRNHLKRSTTSYNEQETTWNDLQRPKKTDNEQETTWKRATTSKKRPKPTYSEQKKKKKRETTNNK